jgi:CheY-like chemotaxis protein
MTSPFDDDRSPSVARRSSGRVLIVDDDRRVAEVIAHELEQYVCVVVDGGVAALHVLASDRDFDVILCDLVMPACSGCDVYDGALRIDASLAERFIFMTGGAFASPAEAFVGRDVERLEKPFDAEVLQASVAKVANRSRARTTATDGTVPLTADAAVRGDRRPR